jgi:hypothetical protein
MAAHRRFLSHGPQGFKQKEHTMKTKHGILKAKTRSVLAGFAVFLIAAAVTLTSCGDGAGNGGDGDDDAFAGTWVHTGEDAFRIIASNGTMKQYLVQGDKEIVRATYTVSGNTVTIKFTAVNAFLFGGNEAWVTWENLTDQQKGFVGGSETAQITISGNSFTKDNITFTKQP